MINTFLITGPGVVTNRDVATNFTFSREARQLNVGTNDGINVVVSCVAIGAQFKGTSTITDSHTENLANTPTLPVAVIVQKLFRDFLVANKTC